MKTLLINVTYTDNADKFWHDSYIKNKKINFNPDTENIHKVIKELCEEDDGMELIYDGKPQGNVYRDISDTGAYQIIGYMYRGKSEIYDQYNTNVQTGRFDVWVTISKIIQFSIDDLRNDFK